MPAILLGIFLVFAYFALWAVVFTGGDADDRAIAEYEAERDAFEAMFE